jgi:hypothetical protein
VKKLIEWLRRKKKAQDRAAAEDKLFERLFLDERAVGGAHERDGQGSERIVIDGKGAELVLQGGVPVITVGEGSALCLRNIVFAGTEGKKTPLIVRIGRKGELVLEAGAAIEHCKVEGNKEQGTDSREQGTESREE